MVQNGTDKCVMHVVRELEIQILSSISEALERYAIMVLRW